MRSRPDRGVAAAVCVAAIIAWTGATAGALQSGNAAAGGKPDRADVERAIESVKRDPNLSNERVIKTLRWKERRTESSFRWPGWLSWIGNLIAWLNESARVLVWCGAAALAGLLVVYLARLGRTRLADRDDDAFVAPTHVRDLDIRPESLPPDIGAAARQLWERGDQRAALALLYRGMLSRLAHVHRVPIRESTTEGDCLVLASAQLPERSEYVARLVRVWQRLGYGHQPVDSAAVYGLCDEFDAALQRGAA